MDPKEDRSLIVFFDLETTLPPCRTIIEFGAILVCPRTLVEKYSHSTLVQPTDLSIITHQFERCKGISRNDVANAPFFVDIALEVFTLLHGRIWAGHNIDDFDSKQIRAAFAQIGWQPPQAKGTIDTYPLLTGTFGRRAGNMKMDSLAPYFGLGEPRHRSLPDVRMNLQVLKNCGAILFLESTFPDVLATESWVNPNDVYIPSIRVSHCPAYRSSPIIPIFHGDVRLKLRCTCLKVQYGIRSRYPRLSFVVEAPPSLCTVVDECDKQAHTFFERSGSTSRWNDAVTNYRNIPTIRLRIPSVRTGNVTRYETQVWQRQASTGAEQELKLGEFDDEALERLFTQGDSIDAFIVVDTYAYEQNAGIRLVAEKLLLHS